MVDTRTIPLRPAHQSEAPYKLERLTVRFDRLLLLKQPAVELLDRFGLASLTRPRRPLASHPFTGRCETSLCERSRGELCAPIAELQCPLLSRRRDLGFLPRGDLGLWRQISDQIFGDRGPFRQVYE